MLNTCKPTSFALKASYSKRFIFPICNHHGPLYCDMQLTALAKIVSRYKKLHFPNYPLSKTIVVAKIDAERSGENYS